MSVIQTQDALHTRKTERVENLAQAIARHEELQKQLQKLIVSWEAERSQLKTKIVQLEHSLVDAIEQSNNPHRATQSSEEKSRLVEEAKRVWCAQWESERSRLLAQLNRLRSSLTALLQDPQS